MHDFFSISLVKLFLIIYIILKLKIIFISWFYFPDNDEWLLPSTPFLLLHVMRYVRVQLSLRIYLLFFFFLISIHSLLNKTWINIQMYGVSLMISMHEKEKVIDERRMCSMNRIAFHFISVCVVINLFQI